MKQLLVFVLLFGFSHSLFAQYADDGGGLSGDEGIYAQLGLFYSFDNRDRSGSTTTDSLLYNVRLAYSFSNAMRVGIKYAAETSSSTESVSSDDDKNTITDYGLFIGYKYDKFFGSVAYLLGGDWNYNDNGTDNKFTKLVGLQIDLGMEFSVGDQFFIGPRLTYKNITYKEQITSGTTTELDPALNRTYLDPFFFITYKF